MWVGHKEITGGGHTPGTGGLAELLLPVGLKGPRASNVAGT